VDWIKKSGLGKYIDAEEVGTMVTQKLDLILASKHRKNWKPRILDAIPAQAERTFKGIQPVTYRHPKKPQGLTGEAIPYCSKFYRSTMYEPEPCWGMKEKMSWV